METIAVYWESMIRTYGFEVRRALALTRITLHDDVPASLEALTDHAAASDLVISTAHRHPSGRVVVEVVVGGALAEGLLARAKQPAKDVEQLAEVDVVFLHGPHYGDRYGIALAAVSALRRGGVEVLLASCAGASIFVAVRAGQADAAVTALRTAFVVPGASAGGERP